MIPFAAMTQEHRDSFHLTLPARISILTRRAQVAAGKGAGVNGRCGEQEPAAYDQEGGPGEAVQRAYVQGNADNHHRPARSMVLARTRAGEEREAVRTILGVVGNGAGGVTLKDRHDGRSVN